MIAIRGILCPVDFSKNSEVAVDYAMAFAEAHKAEILLLHVVHPLAYGAGIEGLTVDVGAQLLRDMEKSANDQIREVAAEARRRYPNVREEVVVGAPFLEIIRIARDRKTDLIVMGTHGRTGLAHMLIGSVAERVVRKAPCPVLTVKHPEHDFVMP